MGYRIFTILLFLLPVYSSAESVLRMATTTSTENSGLLSVLNPPFEEVSGIKVHVIAVGTGKALRLGEGGDVDLVFVHAPAAEKKFVEAGFGVNRQPVMHNDFVILGPASDPAMIRSASSLKDVMKRISGSGSGFVSRGDDSGTHKKEMELWSLAGISPAGKWYLAVGQGMGQVLQIAHETGSYTLSDRGTYLAYRDKIDLEVLFQHSQELENPYHVIMVNPDRHPHIQSALARKYIDYLTGKQGQEIIRTYTINGEQLFYPDVIRQD